MAEGNLGFDVNPGGTRLVIAQLVFLVLAWMVSLLRAHVKLFMNRSVTIDDWLMLVALVRYCSFLGSFSRAVTYQVLAPLHCICDHRCQWGCDGRYGKTHI
jgi:hypothetical protein